MAEPLVIHLVCRTTYLTHHELRGGIVQNDRKFYDSLRRIERLIVCDGFAAQREGFGF